MSDLLSGIASLTKSVQNTLNSYEIRKISDKVQGYVLNFTDAEIKVRDATNEDPWGPTGPEMQEIAGLTFQYDLCSEVMGMLWKRMFQENKVAWRRVYKSLILLNHLLKNGSERVIISAKEHVFELRALESYKCLDERGKDEGLNVRHRVKAIIELVQDEEALRAERRKTKSEGRVKYQGFSKEEMMCKSSGISRYDDSWRNHGNDGKFDNGNGEGDGNNKRRGSSNGAAGKEVNSFDFDGVERSASPELGIREKSPEPIFDDTPNNQDDEFGDFTSARITSSTTNKKTTTEMKISPNPLTHQRQQQISAIRPPSQTATATNISSSTLSSVVVPPKNGGSANIIDLFDFNEPPPSQNVHVSSGGGANTAANNNNVIFAAPIGGGNKNNDLIKNTTNSASSLLDDIFGGAVGGPAQTQSVLDQSLFSSPASMMMPLASNPAPLGAAFQAAQFASLGGANQSANGGAFSPSSQGANKPASSQNVLPSTWGDFKGKVDLDFENLCLKPSPSKPKPTLNDMLGGGSSGAASFGAANYISSIQVKKNCFDERNETK